MSIQSEIDRIKGGIADAYAAVEEMGGTLPDAQNSGNLGGAVRSIPHWSNPNLLDNWDFRKPVNRNGRIEYSGTCYTIDRWRIWDGPSVSLDSDGITLSAADAEKGIFQYLELSRLDSGSVYTISLLTSDNDLLSATGELSNGIFYFGEFGAIRLAFDEAVNCFAFAIIMNANASKKFKAAKLELGSQQTLARQDEDGNWILNDPPDYDLQYALCSQYSPITGEWIGYPHSNPNLLDNWYFADPINQRGKTVYSGPSDTYTIDRWKFNMNSELELLEGNEIKLSSSDQYGGIWQQLETAFGIMAGDTCTFSTLFSEVSAGWYLDIHLVSEDKIIAQQNTLDKVLSPGVVSVTMTIPSSYVPKRGDYFRVFIANIIGGNTAPCKIIATKFELASIQTLAHQDVEGNWTLSDPPPNKALELAKCQRYFQLRMGNFGACDVAGDGIHVGINLPVSMRITPAFSQGWINTQISGASGAGYFENVQLSFKWGSNDSLTLLLPNPDPNSFQLGRPAAVRLDGPLYFDANL